MSGCSSSITESDGDLLASKSKAFDHAVFMLNCHKSHVKLAAWGYFCDIYSFS